MPDTPPFLPRYFLYVVVGLIAYGSLYPFEFDLGALWLALRQGGWLQTILQARWTAVDAIANVFFYAPLGFMLAVRSSTHNWLPLRVLAYTLIGAALSTSMELLQFAVPTREPSIFDVSLNALGTMCGALTAIALRRSLPALQRWSWLRQPQRDRAVYLLMAMWLTLKGAPFIPRLGLYRIWMSLESLREGQWTAVGMIEAFAQWLLVLTALRAALQRQYFWIAVSTMCVYAVAAQLLFRQHALRLDELVGAIPALLLIGALRSRRTETTIPVVFVLALAAIIAAGLAPYRFSVVGNAFNLVPFHGTLETAVQSAAFVLLGKLLLYGGCLWAGLRAGFPRLAVTVLMLVIISMIEMAQIYIPGRVAEITDPLLVLGLALVMSLPKMGIEPAVRPRTRGERSISRRSS